MNITKLEIANFLTISKATLSLDDRGLLLVQGDNQDDTSAKSNGAGKSSIVDALCWALYGETARGVSGDDVVNDTAKKDCSVIVTLQDSGFEYSVRRYRKHKTGKNMLTVTQWEIAAAVGADLSKGTDRETQAVVNRIMGCGLEVFMGAIYAAQENMPDLPGMTDKALKLLIEEAAGVEQLADAYAEARRLSLVADNEHNNMGAHHKATCQQLATITAELAAAQTEHKTFEDSRRDKARTKLSEVKAFDTAKAETLAQIVTYDVPTLTARKTQLDAELAGHKSQQTELDTLQATASTRQSFATSKLTNMTGMRVRLDAMMKGLSDIEEQIGKPCGECAKLYCEHDLDAAKKARTATIAGATEALRSEADVTRKSLADSKMAQETVAVFKGGMTDVSAAASELAVLNGTLTGVASLERAVGTIDAKIEAVKVAAKGFLTEGNPWTKTVESKTKQELEWADKVVTNGAIITRLEEKALLYADAVKVFGPAGVRAHILDTVTPFLNEKTAEYLSALADGNIHATWSTLSKTAKGELKEKFNIEVTNDKGAKSFKGLSGGEKRKVRLAASMALQDMVATRAEKPIRLYIADEVDHALDDSGLERLMGVLDKKAKERGTVLVISHNALSDWIDQVITVTKAGGVSTVSGATERGL